MASKLTWFLCEGSHLTWFECWDRNVTCFLCGDSRLTVYGPKLTCFKRDDRLTCFLCGYDGWNWLGFWMRAANRLVVKCEHRNWLGFCLGGRYWLDFSVGGRNWLDFIQFRDRNWFGLCLGVENDLVLVSGSKLTLILWDVRPQTDTYVESWQIDVLVMFQRCILYKRTKEDFLQIPVGVEWVAQGCIRYTQTTEVRGSNPTEVVV